MKLRFAYMKNPRIQPLVDGTVSIPGVEPEWEVGHAADLHLRHLNENVFDVFEFSISNFLITLDRQEERPQLRWTAIPIFLSKAFMWLDFYVNAGAGIETLADLKGRTVGIPDFQMTAGVWMRIVLRHLYDIRPRDISWVNGRPPSQTHGSGVTERLTASIRLRRLEEHETLNELIQRGEVQAGYGDSHSAAIHPSPAVTSLLSVSQARQVITDFYQKTGMTPVNHVLLMQQRLAEQHPELPLLLYQAFEQSKREAYARARREAEGYLLFPDADFARQAADFGEDPFPCGLAANRQMLETVADQVYSEGLISRKPEIESLFTPATRST